MSDVAHDLVAGASAVTTAIVFLCRVQYWAAMWWFGVDPAEIPPDVRHALEVISIYDHGHGGGER